MNITGCIVTYNNADCIEICINSLFRCFKKYSFTLYISDNGSTDGTVELIEKRFPDVILINNRKNLGFGMGHNQILPTINHGYHFIINPDIYVDSDVMGNLIDYMEENPDIGIITPLIKNVDGSIQHLPKRTPTIRYLGLSKLPGFHYLRKEYTRENENLTQPTEISFCTGCFFCIRSALLKEISGFDKRFFMYFEDADLTREVRLSGYKIVYYPFTYVIHRWKRDNVKSLKGIFREIYSMIKYFNKWGWRF